jgi:hypothetical protein
MTASIGQRVDGADPCRADGRRAMPGVGDWNPIDLPQHNTSVIDCRRTIARHFHFRARRLHRKCLLRAQIRSKSSCVALRIAPAAVAVSLTRSSR